MWATFEHSAGDGAVLHLLTSPLARGLFARVMAQSLGPSHLGSLDAAQDAGKQLPHAWCAC